MRQVGAGNCDVDRLGSGREQQAVIGKGLSARSQDMATTGVDAHDLRPETQVDAVVGVELRPLQRHPRVRSLAGEIIL